MRHQGVDFFLFSHSPRQESDMDAESYLPAIWDLDQDLCAMQQHVNSEEFQQNFKDGVRSYLASKWCWKAAISAPREVDDTIITTVFGRRLH
jgi:hypothetical protein